MNILGIIPARYASTRFPGKPLVLINGKTMIERVYEQACRSKLLSDVIVATDDERIYETVGNFGGKVMYTSANHKNGTERCAEIATKSTADFIINIQGDEPFISPEQIDLLASCIRNTSSPIATLIMPHAPNAALADSSRIKVVVNKTMQAMYFSRSMIPFARNESNVTFYKHIGLYAFKKEALLSLIKLEPTLLEETESLEQLRWLENGYSIQCAVTEIESISIDTPEDLQNVLLKVNSNN